MIKYNEKYDRWVTEDGLVYRYNSKQDKLILCNQYLTNSGYLRVVVGNLKRQVLVHRLVYETFKGLIPEGYQIDHINTIRNDNRIENLRCVTHKENMNNPNTLKKIHVARSEFGKKFFEYYGIIGREDFSLYRKEHIWYKRHGNKCRWEV